MAMVVSAFDPQERGKALGLNITGVYVGLSLSPFLGGVLNYQLGWRSVILFAVPLLIIIIALLLRIDDEWITFEGILIDVKGSVAYGIGIALFIYGFTILNETLGVILTVVGIMILIVFAMIELRQEHPVFDIKFLKNRVFLSANLASLCAYLATFAVTTILNYHLQYIKGFDSQTA
jgi:MFS family permease